MLALLLLPARLAAGASENLVFNGDFGDPGNPLLGWKHEYTAAGEGWYKDNAELVSVLPHQDGRKGVLRLFVKTQWLADNPGVKVDSKPIPFDPLGRYRFSLRARTTGPNARVLVEGYTWEPGIKPHADPSLDELRKVYKFETLLFDPDRSAAFSHPSRAWQKASMEFPGKIRSELMKSKWEEIRFIVVHVVGIGGAPGDLFVDDVEITRLK
jgi:hypothetical protein